MSEEVRLLVWLLHLEVQAEEASLGETNFWKTNHERITIIYSRADEGIREQMKAWTIEVKTEEETERRIALRRLRWK